MPSARKHQRHLTSTYVEVKHGGKYEARAVDGRSGREATSTRASVVEATRAAREKMKVGRK